MFSKNKILKTINMHTNNIKEKFANIIDSKRYDLPLDNSEDTRFLITLITLMSFLAVLALSGVFALNSMTNKWSSGLENKITIEISVETKDLYEMLSSHKSVRSVEILGSEEIQELISPWIGNDLDLANIPLPGLIAVEIKNLDDDDFHILKKDIQKTSKHANIETHEQWLADLINFTKTLKTLSLLIALLIGSITTIAIASAVRTRLAIHHDEVELLHYMGATDDYIIRQFQRHTIILALKGAIIGTVIGMSVIYSLTFFSRGSGSELMPVIYIGISGVFILLFIPVIASIITAITSHITVLRSLAKMP